MSLFMSDEEFDELYAETIEEMKSYPDMTDDEATVLTMSLLVPRGWEYNLKIYDGIPEARSKELRLSGIKKYLDGGGREHWQ